MTDLEASLYEHLRSAIDDAIADRRQLLSARSSPGGRDLSFRRGRPLTATPHPKTDADHIVFHYPLAEAIADGYVKVPVLVARRDGSAEIRHRQLTWSASSLRATPPRCMPGRTEAKR
ncbi:MAG: hypothetical protein M9942_08895 [Microthrixaceae bacterium]|nr:hypothetical protein [Microthrixaceae bacterium]